MHLNRPSSMAIVPLWNSTSAGHSDPHQYFPFIYIYIHQTLRANIASTPSSARERRMTIRNITIARVSILTPRTRSARKASKSLQICTRRLRWGLGFGAPSCHLCLDYESVVCTQRRMRAQPGPHRTGLCSVLVSARTELDPFSWPLVFQVIYLKSVLLDSSLVRSSLVCFVAMLAQVKVFAYDATAVRCLTSQCSAVLEARAHS